MGYVELPDSAPAGGKLHGVIKFDEQELRATVSLLKEALAELTREMPNGVTHAAAAPAGSSTGAPPSAAAAGAPRAATASPAPTAATAPGGVAAAAAAAGLPAHLASLPQHLQQQPQQQQQQALRPPPQPQPQQQQQQPPRPQPVQAPPPRPAPVPAPAPVAAPVPQQATAPQRPVPPPQQQQQQRQPAPPQPSAQQQQQQQQQQQSWQQPPRALAAAAPAAPPQHAVGAVDTTAAPAAASSHWRQCFTTDAEEHGHQPVAAVAYTRGLPGLPGGDGHSGWLVTSSKGLLNLWETTRAAAGEENVLLCMHSQAVELTATKLVLEPATKLLFGASVERSKETECVSVHSLDVEVGLLSYRYKFGPPVEQPRTGQRLLQQVVSLHGINPGVRNTIMTAYGERLLLFSTKDSAAVPANTLVHKPKMHCIAHPGSIVTALQTSQGIEGCHNLISGAQDGKIHIWDLQQPPRDNSPAMRLYRHTRDVTGLAQITDERLVSGSLDGTVLLWDLRYPQGPLFTQRAPGNASVLKVAAGPWGDVVAVGTSRGLHCVELFDFDAPMTNIAAFPLQQPFTDLVFNAVTHDLYAGTRTGGVTVFSRRA